MASADGITVAVERVIHDALRESIQRIADQHGIKVKEVCVEWASSQPMAGPARHLVMEVGVRTVSTHP